jgi:hypothetical protein
MQPVQFGWVGDDRPMSIKRGHIELSVDIDERGGDWLRPTLVSIGVVLCVALIYQLIVGGIKIETTSGRLIIDAGGLVYWWQLVNHR